MAQLASKNQYSGETFKRIDQKQDVIVGATFAECKFVRCDFSDTAFESCRFLDCSFEDCTLKMVKVEDTTFVRVKFNKCSLMGVNWSEGNWSEWAAKTGSLEFEGCDLKYSVFLGLELKKLKLKDCTAHEANFAQANLSEGDFAGTDFMGAVFLKTDLTKANFVGAKNYTLSINDNKTKGAKFALPEAIQLLYHMGIVVVDPNDR